MALRLISVAAAAAFVVSTCGGTSLYSFGGDVRPIVGTGAPTSLNSMNPNSAASVTNVQNPVGDGSIGFNGGLVSVGGTLFAIGNDSNGVASIYSFGLDGQGLTPVSSDFNVGGDGNANVFQNGLTAVGSSFYATGVAGDGTESLFQIGNGSAALVRTLNTFGGTYSGLSYDQDTGSFLAIIVNSGSGDLLVQFQSSGSVGVVANLTDLDGALIGTHLGGLVYVGGNTAYDLNTDPNMLTGQLEQISLGNSVSTQFLYDTGVPLMENHGLAAVSEVPEPCTMVLIVGGLVGLYVRRRVGTNTGCSRARLSTSRMLPSRLQQPPLPAYGTMMNRPE